MIFKSGDIIGKITKHLPGGLVVVDYAGTILTLPESDNELVKANEIKAFILSRVDLSKIDFNYHYTNNLLAFIDAHDSTSIIPFYKTS